jgi:hypothetical protein
MGWGKKGANVGKPSGDSGKLTCACNAKTPGKFVTCACTNSQYFKNKPKGWICSDCLNKNHTYYLL